MRDVSASLRDVMKRAAANDPDAESRSTGRVAAVQPVGGTMQEPFWQTSPEPHCALAVQGPH